MCLFLGTIRTKRFMAEQKIYDLAEALDWRSTCQMAPGILAALEAVENYEAIVRDLRMGRFRERTLFILHTKANDEVETVAEAKFVTTTDGSPVKRDMVAKGAWLEQFMVVPRLRGRQLGRFVLCLVACLLANEGYTRLDLQAAAPEEAGQERLFRFYERMGFVRRAPFQFNIMTAPLADLLAHCLEA